ncbi:signal recognition particle, SRP19 subunit [Immersiella caudata]|uniref:Signal recognition particle, SRP19 subunit n=1 Tax=Immersiella caudata TaxID=314043 RepID=A0AA39X3S9_9PEZI|nr:signal recognition particle, SRP19 subunit [Immersiella caudata]
MPSHPRVEEVSDSDVDMSDPSEDDIDDFADTDILRRVADTKKHAAPAQQQQQAAPPTQPRQQPQQPPNYPHMQTTNDDSAYRAYQCLYPVYFDAIRTRAEGRRVASNLAVRSPLATEIVAACASLRLPAVFEAGKLHPKDWANPGRVRVNLKEPHVAGRIKNKHHLYLLVAKHLREHPVTEDGPALRMVVRGAPPPPQVEEGKPWPRPAVPRGWKIGELLPYYSPAMTGGGVSENFLKDMMKEMQGGGDMASMLAAAAGGGGQSGSGSGGGKKDKKGKGK